ncbi:MAG: FKBP-type peptidyl-prolyl cis-trans isomerase [Planctomycetota bacterium]
MRFCSSLVLLSLLCGCVDSPAKQTDAPVPTAPALEKTANVDHTKPGPVDADAPKDFTETASGLKYKVLRKTDGKKPQRSDTVVVNYRGTLDDGTEFDSSYSRGTPIDFPLSGVIKGWTEGMEYCPLGGMIELEIPSDLGYGPGGTRGIPGGATLHFIVELLEIR